MNSGRNASEIDLLDDLRRLPAITDYHGVWLRMWHDANGSIILSIEDCPMESVSAKDEFNQDVARLVPGKFAPKVIQQVISFSKKKEFGSDRFERPKK